MIRMVNVLDASRTPGILPGKKWCRLRNMRCIPFPSCEERVEEEKCIYESDSWRFTVTQENLVEGTRDELA